MQSLDSDMEFPNKGGNCTGSGLCSMNACAFSGFIVAVAMAIQIECQAAPTPTLCLQSSSDAVLVFGQENSVIQIQNGIYWITARFGGVDLHVALHVHHLGSEG